METLGSIVFINQETFAKYKPEEHHDHRLSAAYASYLDTASMGNSLIERALKTWTVLSAPSVRFERAKLD